MTEKAMQHYERSADYFKGEESNSSANKCMLKVFIAWILPIGKGYNIYIVSVAEIIPYYHMSQKS